LRAIYRFRAHPWQTVPKAIKVDRSTAWGNPYRVGIHGTAAQCVRLYIAHYTDDAAFRAQAQQELAGKDLACWCALDTPYCHGEVLLRWANEDTASTRAGVSSKHLSVGSGSHQGIFALKGEK
jgi:hypothetical protein